MVYVDILLPCIRSSCWRYDKSCHLFADSIEELKLFADGIGLKMEWFQSSKKFPHFDLTANKRRMAVLNGAKEVGKRFVVKFMKKTNRKNNEF